VAAELTRYYNRSPQQLHAACWHTIQLTFPGKLINTWQPGTFSFQTGMRPPFNSWGERVEIRIVEPGVVNIQSDYLVKVWMRFERGENLCNVERFARTLEANLAGVAPACPHCGHSMGMTEQPYCNACGNALANGSSQPPVPDKGPGVLRLATVIIWTITLGFLLLPLALPFALPWLLGN
jgi:hypothetical protein